MSQLRLLLSFVFTVGLCTAPWAQELIAKPSQAPLVDISLQFHTGAAYDPDHLQGAASLVAACLTQGSTRNHSYEAILKLLYPSAVSIRTTVDKETTTFYTTLPSDRLKDITPIFIEMMTRPAFLPKDVDRLKADAENHLTQDLRSHNDEELAKEALYLSIYPPTHPYGHANAGSVSDIRSATPAKLKNFYQTHFTDENFTLAVAGGYPQGYPERLRHNLALALPKSNLKGPKVRSTTISQPTLPSGRHVTLVDKDTRSVAISLGFPIDVTRSHPDWPALNLVRSYLGEHRSSNSYLYQQLREARGLNYGDYAYLEYFPMGMFKMQPDPYYARSLQIFQVWIRPVPPEQAVFTLRATLYELDKLIHSGLSKEDFEATRSFLIKNTPLQIASSARSLGYDLDDRFYNLTHYVSRTRRELQALTLEEVNRAITTHFNIQDLEIVMVTPDADKLKTALLSNASSPITYKSPKPSELLQEDKVIATYPLNLHDVTILSASKLFE